jgi:hypothetical protein
VGGTSEHKVTCDQVYRQWHRRIAPSFLWAFLGRFPDEIFGILFPEFLKNFKQGKVTKAQVDTTTVYQKKYPSTGIPCIAVRVLGLNKSFWKVFYGWIYNPYNWFTQPRARRGRARRARNNPPAIVLYRCTSPPTAIYPPIYLLYTWQQENQYMARARCGRGFP